MEQPGTRGLKTNENKLSGTRLRDAKSRQNYENYERNAVKLNDIKVFDRWNIEWNRGFIT